MFIARELVMRDSDGHQKKHTLVEGGQMKFASAFNKFLQKYVSENNTTFRIEETLTGEALVIETAVGILARQYADEQSPSTFRRFADRLDMAELALRFGTTGHLALDRFARGLRTATACFSTNRTKMLRSLGGQRKPLRKPGSARFARCRS